MLPPAIANQNINMLMLRKRHSHIRGFTHHEKMVAGHWPLMLMRAYWRGPRIVSPHCHKWLPVFWLLCSYHQTLSFIHWCYGYVGNDFVPNGKKQTPLGVTIQTRHRFSSADQNCRSCLSLTWPTSRCSRPIYSHFGGTQQIMRQYFFVPRGAFLMIHLS